jgi:hypothetical protein
MVLKVESLMEQQKYDGALSYLERYLGRYGKSLAAWRFRVLIRLEQEQRATAAAEYSALNTALGRHEPDVLREVVLGAGGRWLLSDYSILARCAGNGLVDAAFFEDLLSAQHLGHGSMSKVAVSDDEISAVLDALPGSLATKDTWPLVLSQGKATGTAIRARRVVAAARHLAAGGLDEPAQKIALSWITDAAGDSDPRLRDAALHASWLLPSGPGKETILAGMIDSLLKNNDLQRAMSMFLLGPSESSPAWTATTLERWSESETEPIATLAHAAQQHQKPTRKHEQYLRAATKDKSAAKVLAAATGPKGDPKAAWASLHVEDRRLWAAAMVRSRAADKATWAALALGDSDSPVVQASASALAMPRETVSQDKLSESLRAVLNSRDASSRAEAGRTAIVRQSNSLLPDLEGLAKKGDERVLLAVLGAVIETGSTDWNSLIIAGLESDIALVREKAVDAAASGCNKAQHKLLSELLTDADPHVAVRAAAVLYLNVGVRPN